MPPFGSEFVTEAPSVRMSEVDPRLPLDTKFVPGTGGVALVIHCGDAGSQRSQRDHVAIDQRKIVDELAIDDLTGFRIFGLDSRASAPIWMVWLAPATLSERLVVAFSFTSTLNLPLVAFSKPPASADTV